MTREKISVKTISIYPIKSLDPVIVPSARILPAGSLEHDREFALFDAQGNFINGKRNAKIHHIRAEYDLPNSRVTLSTEDRTPTIFDLMVNTRPIEQWFEDILGFPVSLRRNTETGFPDDLESPGPTIIGSASLKEVSDWFGIHDVDETRRRFRANIEVETTVPFWEDCLFGPAATARTFRIGDVTIDGVNPCQRCIVPSRGPSTGISIPDFQRHFAIRREQMLPLWAEKSRFNHYYRLAVNTRIPETEAGKSFRRGDEVVIETPRNVAMPSPR